MTVTNRAAIRNSLNLMGKDVLVRNYTDKSTPTYDSETQEPVYPYEETFCRAQIVGVTKNQVFSLGGLIILSDKQFIFPEDVTVEEGDSIFTNVEEVITPENERCGTLTDDSEEFKVITFSRPLHKKIAFAREENGKSNS